MKSVARLAQRMANSRETLLASRAEEQRSYLHCSSHFFGFYNSRQQSLPSTLTMSSHGESLRILRPSNGRIVYWKNVDRRNNKKLGKPAIASSIPDKENVHPNRALFRESASKSSGDTNDPFKADGKSFGVKPNDFNMRDMRPVIHRSRRALAEGILPSPATTRLLPLSKTARPKSDNSFAGNMSPSNPGCLFNGCGGSILKEGPSNRNVIPRTPSSSVSFCCHLQATSPKSVGVHVDYATPITKPDDFRKSEGIAGNIEASDFLPCSHSRNSKVAVTSSKAQVVPVPSPRHGDILPLCSTLVFSQYSFFSSSNTSWILTQDKLCSRVLRNPTKSTRYDQSICLHDEAWKLVYGEVDLRPQVLGLLSSFSFRQDEESDMSLFVRPVALMSDPVCEGVITEPQDSPLKQQYCCVDTSEAILAQQSASSPLEATFNADFQQRLNTTNSRQKNGVHGSAYDVNELLSSKRGGAAGSDYTNLISTYASSRDSEGAEKAECILRHVLFEYNAGRGLARPDGGCYNKVLHAYANRGDAAKAEEIMQMMCDVYDTGDTLAEPNNRHYTTLIFAWQKSKDPNGPDHCEHILEKMHTMHEQGILSNCKPDAFTYTSVLHCWADSDHCNAAERAEALFRKMLYRFHNGDKSLCPDTIAYSNLTNVYTKNRDCQRDESLLWELVDCFLKGNASCKPTTRNFSTVLATWSISDFPNAAARAEDIVWRWLSIVEKTNLPAKPDNYSYCLLLKCW